MHSHRSPYFKKDHNHFSDSSFHALFSFPKYKRVPWCLILFYRFVLLAVAQPSICMLNKIQKNFSTLVLILVYRHFCFVNKISRWLTKDGHQGLLVLFLKPQKLEMSVRHSIFSASYIRLANLLITSSTLQSSKLIFYFTVSRNSHAAWYPLFALNGWVILVSTRGSQSSYDNKNIGDRYLSWKRDDKEKMKFLHIGSVLAYSRELWSVLPNPKGYKLNQ